jgi:hypothetical protein
MIEILFVLIFRVHIRERSYETFEKKKKPNIIRKIYQQLDANRVAMNS